MSARRVLSAALLGVVVVGALTPVSAAKPKPKPKPKPITETYEVTATPWPAALEQCEGAPEDVSMDSREFKVPAAGKFTMELTGFEGDWDSRLVDSDGGVITEGSGTQTPNANTSPGTNKDTIEYKFKRAQTINIQVCNFVGTPEATVTFTFTFA